MSCRKTARSYISSCFFGSQNQAR